MYDIIPILQLIIKVWVLCLYNL